MSTDKTQSQAINVLLSKEQKTVYENRTTKLLIPSYKNQPAEIHVVEQIIIDVDFINTINDNIMWHYFTPVEIKSLITIDLNGNYNVFTIETIADNESKCNNIKQINASEFIWDNEDSYCYTITKHKVSILDYLNKPKEYKAMECRMFDSNLSNLILIDYGINRNNARNLFLEVLLKGTPLQKNVLGYIGLCKYIISYL